MTTLWPSSCQRASCPKYTSSSRTCAGWHRPAMTSNGVWFYPGAGLHPRRCLGFRLSQATLALIGVAVDWNRLSIPLEVVARVRHGSFFDLRKQHWIFKRKSIFVKNESMADSDVNPKTNRPPIPLHSHTNRCQSGLAQRLVIVDTIRARISIGNPVPSSTR